MLEHYRKIFIRSVIRKGKKTVFGAKAEFRFKTVKIPK